MTVEPPPLAGFREGTLTDFRRLVVADWDAVRRRTGRLGPYLFPYATATALYRLSRFLRLRGRVGSARGVAWLNQALTGAELEPLACVGPGFQLAHTDGVLLGQGVSAGRNLTLHGQVLLGSTSGESRARPSSGFPTLGDDVTIYAKASVLGPVVIGDGAVIGAHALVLDDVPEGAVAKGVPARSDERRD
jgi:serine O-acetyltransferase